MAQELELVIRVRYEPIPEYYIDETTTVADMTMEKMAEMDAESFTDDPERILEYFNGTESIAVNVMPFTDDYTYFTKETTQRAILFDGNNIEEIWGIFGEKGITVVPGSIGLLLSTADGLALPCIPGQYVMEDNKPNTFYPCNQEMFNKKYEQRL